MSSTAIPAAASRGSRGPSRLRAAYERLGLGGSVALAFILLLALAAALAPVLAPQDPAQQDLLNLFAGPSAEHPLGTDQLGRDLLSRLLYGARPSLLGPLLVVAMALVVAVPLAVLAAWRGGWVDALIGRAFDLVFSFPGLLLAVLVVAVTSPGLAGCTIALAIGFVPWIGRVVRGAALRERNAAYIRAVELQGGSAVAICVRHLLPNILPIIAAQASVSFGYALIDLSVLSFLGLGVQPPQPDWGLMVNTQDSIMEGHPQEALYAGLLIVGCVVAVGTLGNRISDRQEQRA